RRRYTNPKRQRGRRKPTKRASARSQSTAILTRKPSLPLRAGVKRTPGLVPENCAAVDDLNLQRDVCSCALSLILIVCYIKEFRATGGIVNPFLWSQFSHERLRRHRHLDVWRDRSKSGSLIAARRQTGARRRHCRRPSCRG